MKKTITILAILLLILAFGCAKQVEEAPEGPVSISVPDLGQVEHTEEKVVEPEVQVEEEPEEEVTPLGSRLSEEEEVVAATDMPEDAYGVMLYADKTMSESALTIKSGEEIYFRNMDTFPHQILIEQENPDKTGAWDRWLSIAEGDRLNEGESWIFKFDDAGEYVVRDRFSGDMRMIVTVE